MILWYRRILRDEKRGSVWECDFELMMLRMAFFALLQFFGYLFWLHS